MSSRDPCARVGGLKIEQHVYPRRVAKRQPAQIKDQNPPLGLVEYIAHPIVRLPYPGQVEFAEKTDEYLTVDGRGVNAKYRAP